MGDPALPEVVPHDPLRQEHGQLGRRKDQQERFTRIVKATTVAQNAIRTGLRRTGLRGTSETALLEEPKAFAGQSRDDKRLSLRTSAAVIAVLCLVLWGVIFSVIAFLVR